MCLLSPFLSTPNLCLPCPLLPFQCVPLLAKVPCRVSTCWASYLQVLCPPTATQASWSQIHLWTETWAPAGQVEGRRWPLLSEQAPHPLSTAWLLPCQPCQALPRPSQSASYWDVIGGCVQGLISPSLSNTGYSWVVFLQAPLLILLGLK